MRLRTLYSGISAGTELTAYRGSNPYLTKQWDDERRLFVDGSTSFSYPVDGWGYEEVGEVVEVGAEAAGLAPRRPGLGHLGPPHRHGAEGRAAAQRVLDPDADPRIGIFSQIGAIGLNVVLDADIHVGETVAVFGLGRARPDRRPAGPAQRRPGDRGRRHRRRAGSWRWSSAPTTSLDATEGSVAERIRELTGGRGADVCLEVTGNYRALHEAIRSVAYSSRVCAAGFMQGDGDRACGWGRSSTTTGCSWSARRSRASRPSLQHRWDGYRLARTAIDLAVSGRLRLTELITHTMPMAQAPEAFRMLDEHPEQALQVVLSFDEALEVAA